MRRLGATTLPFVDTDDLLALSVLGPQGIIDLVVPGAASAENVAAEYASQTGLTTPPALLTGLGAPLPTGVPLSDTSVAAGDVLVAVTDLTDLTDPLPDAVPDASDGSGDCPGTATFAGAPVGVRLWVAVSAGVAVLAGWCAAHLADTTEQTVAVNVLLVAAVIGLLPFGRYAGPRSATAPVFSAAAAYALVWEPDPDSLPLTLGVAGLAAAVTAAAGRALLPDVSADGTESRRDEAHIVWMATGVLLFLTAGLAAIFQFRPSIVWSLLLVFAMLGARLVPRLAIDVPDQLLIDLERLAVNAWSAREQPTGRRGRMVIARGMVARIVDRGQRIISGASLAIAAVAAGSAYLLLTSDLPGFSRLGAGLLVFFVGASLLFAAGSYRNRAARLLLRAAGLACWVALAGERVPTWSPASRSWLVLGAVALGLLCIVVAVASGRGWRSVWWARRAEVGESMCSAFAIAALSLSTGLFSHVWVLTSR